MSKGLPELVYPLQLARSGRSLQGRIPVARMRRLAEALCSTAGEIVVDLRFGRGEDGRLCIEGAIQGNLWLMCQRCLRPLSWSASCEVRLGMIPSVMSEERLALDYEPLVAQEDCPLSPLEIVEDELILALPIVPMHPEGVCSKPLASSLTAEADSGDTRQKPFAVLKQLKDGLPS